MSAAAEPGWPDLAVLRERIACIPDRYRRFTESQRRATRYYRIPPDVLVELLDLGLPHRGDGSERTYDVNDLKSVSMALPVRSPQRDALRAMADALVQGQDPGGVGRSVDIYAHCPDHGHEGLCEFELVPQAAESWHTTGVHRVEPGHFELAVRVPGGGPHHLDLNAAERQLVADAGRLRFHRIPFVLNSDLGFVTETGLADCRLAALYLDARGRELGLRVRQATGLFLSRPFSPRHFWLEFARGDGWQPADPFFLTELVRWGLLDGVDWPPYRIPLGAFWQVDIYPDAPLVTHRAGSPISIMTN